MDAFWYFLLISATVFIHNWSIASNSEEYLGMKWVLLSTLGSCCNTDLAFEIIIGCPSQPLMNAEHALKIKMDIQVKNLQNENNAKSVLQHEPRVDNKTYFSYEDYLLFGFNISIYN
jgi:hypothetical protein